VRAAAWPAPLRSMFDQYVSDKMSRGPVTGQHSACDYRCVPNLGWMASEATRAVAVSIFSGKGFDPLGIRDGSDVRAIPTVIMSDFRLPVCRMPGHGGEQCGPLSQH
jgi:hypothetical protein